MEQSLEILNFVEDVIPVLKELNNNDKLEFKDPGCLSNFIEFINVNISNVDIDNVTLKHDLYIRLNNLLKKYYNKFEYFLNIGVITTCFISYKLDKVLNFKSRDDFSKYSKYLRSYFYQIPTFTQKNRLYYKGDLIVFFLSVKQDKCPQVILDQRHMKTSVLLNGEMKHDIEQSSWPFSGTEFIQDIYFKETFQEILTRGHDSYSELSYDMMNIYHENTNETERNEAIVLLQKISEDFEAFSIKTYAEVKNCLSKLNNIIKIVDAEINLLQPEYDKQRQGFQELVGKMEKQREMSLLRRMIKSETSRITKVKTNEYLIPLPFDIKTNKKIVDFLYSKLNNICFKVSPEHFKSIFFGTDKHFNKINLEIGTNMFLKLFLGFEHIDHEEQRVSFSGLMKFNEERFLTLENNFNIKDKPTGDVHIYLNKKYDSTKHSKPREFKLLFPVIVELKNRWYNF